MSRHTAKWTVLIVGEGIVGAVFRDVFWSAILSRPWEALALFLTWVIVYGALVEGGFALFRPRGKR